MTVPLRLFDLFGEPNADALAAVWSQRIQPTTGFPGNIPPNDLKTWLAAWNNSVDIFDVRTGADRDRVTAEATLVFRGTAAYPDGIPFVLASIPDVEFRVKPVAPVDDSSRRTRAFASMSDNGVEVVLEQLPVEIRLPTGLIESHPKPGGGIADGTPAYDVGEFRPTFLDDLKIHYDRGQPSSIFVHIRLHMTEQGEFAIRPAVPVSFGKCIFSGIPALAVHDFQLIPSPSMAPREVHWLRHDVSPWSPQLSAPLDGLFSIRSLHVDPETTPIADLANYLNSHKDAADSGTPPPVVPPPPPGSTSDGHAEFVLDDLIVPFYAVYGVPIPRHVTVGVRRRILDKSDPKEIFTFDNAPVRAFFTRSPETGFIVDSFFFKSLPSGVGLTFDAAFVFGDTHDVNNKSEAMALGIGLEEEYTFTVSYKREFSTTTGLPEPGTGAAKTLNRILHFEIATNTVDVMGIKLGYSLGRHFQQHSTFGGSTLATIDLFVTLPPTGSKASSVVKLRSLNGEIVKFVLEGIGWRLGSMHLEGAAFPDGVVLLIANRFGLVLQEIGLRAEDNATYLSVSGGIQIKIPSGFSGALVVKRLRARIAGSSDAPPFKMDGFFLNLSAPGFALEAGGYYTESSPAPDVKVSEFALTGSARFGAGEKAYTLGFDFLLGNTSSPTEDFDYFFAQAFFSGSIPLGAIALRGLRALFARNMKPKLEPLDRDSRELRYYNWYRRSDPLTIPGDRRIAAWDARDDSVAFGAGASISFPGFDSTCELTAFVLFVSGADEHAFLIVVEVRLLHNPKPIGYLAVEYDFRHDEWRGVLGVELRLSDFEKNAPDWMDQIGSLTGTVFIGNHPPTFAIGHLDDQKTWLLLHLDYDLWVRSFFEMGVCLEFVKKGPHGVGFFIRVEGGINAGIVRVVYHAGFGFSFEVFFTGSHDYAAEVFIEAALRIVLFGFLHFGISGKATFRTVGAHPSRGELQMEVRLETPWFMPDVTWTLDIPFGTLSPGDLSTSTTPLRAAGGTQGLNLKSAAMHVERFDQAYANDRASRTFSVNELQAGGPDEATRLANFAADTSVHPIGIDSTLAVEFAVAVNDKLALGTGVAPNLGNQSSGDLSLTYDLVGIAVRRRARFGSDRSWSPLDPIVELPPDFSDPNGVKLTGSFSAETIAAHWDLDQTIGDQPATQRLLLNSSTPFHFVTSNSTGDEELVRGFPFWPCCDPKRNILRFHDLTFQDQLPGTRLAGPFRFSGSRSTLRFNRAATARPQRAGTTLPAGTIVADVPASAGVIAHLDFDEDVAYCFLTVGWSVAQGQLSLVAFDFSGKVVGSKSVLTASPGDFQGIRLGAQAPIRRIEIRVVRPQGGFQPAAPFVEIYSLAYSSLTDQLNFLREEQTCGDSLPGYEGKGKLFFLPNHEYEVALTTRVTVAHPSAAPVSADVPEYLYYKTKGLPGLNLAQRVGEEVEQYVAGAYGGGRGFLYRREPAVVAFNEDFFVAVPLTLRPAGTIAEHTTLMRMQLVTRADSAVNAGTPFTATSADWIVAHRGTVGEDRVSTWDLRASIAATFGTPMRSLDPMRARLASLTQRPFAACGLSDPLDVTSTVLSAPPQGQTDPDDSTQELWPASLAFTATVRMEGAAFVERIVFDAADLTAMERTADDGSFVPAAWSVVDGVLTAASDAARRFAIFGDGTWNHFTVSVNVTLLDAAAGVAIALPSSGAPSQGLFALVERTADGRRLVLYRRTSGAEMIELAHEALPAAADPTAAISLQVSGFDDRIQLRVGEQSIEAERDEQREGRVALVASGGAEFRNLRLAGVPIYAFPFRTSRYRSFNEHVLSWSGRIDDVQPDALGPGTTTGTIASLWTATQADITAAMQADAPAAARDAVFGRWLKELGLALKDEVPAFEVSRYLVNAQTAALLLESPEPIDFTTEVTAKLERRINIIVDPALGGGPGGARIQVPDGPDMPAVSILDVSRHAEGLDLDLALHNVATLLTDDRVILVESVEPSGNPDGGVARLRVYTGRLAISSRTARVRTYESDDVTVVRAADSIFRAALAGVTPGRAIAILPGISALGGQGLVPVPDFIYLPVALHVLQSGSGRQALVVPMANAAAPLLLAPGTYRLTLTINRARWSTTAPPDANNHYSDSAALVLALT